MVFEDCSECGKNGGGIILAAGGDNRLITTGLYFNPFSILKLLKHSAYKRPKLDNSLSEINLQVFARRARWNFFILLRHKYSQKT